MRRTVLLCWMLLAVPGCTTAAKNYFSSRWRDTVDVVHVNLLWNSCGLLANAGPLVVGYEAPLFRNLPSYGQHAIGMARVGVVFADYVLEKGAAYGLLVPLSRLDVGRWDAPGAAWGKGYGGKAPGWGSLGFDVGLLVGLGVHVDVVELVDLVSGFFGADISKDDWTGTGDAPSQVVAWPVVAAAVGGVVVLVAVAGPAGAIAGGMLTSGN